ncbi:MAG: hypothetical protein ACOC35_12645 [Promethearchaeia archaeon]
MKIDLKPKRVPILGHKGMRKIKQGIESRNKEHTISLSLDLNISTDKVEISPQNGSFNLPNGETINFPRQFDPKKKICYTIMENQVHMMQTFDPKTDLFYQLVPTSYRPILKISATPMHKKPFLDHLEKVKPRGKIFDGGTGLGYSAIIAGKTAENLLTVEWDPNVLDMARYNPHSYELFTNPNIQIIQADITEEIKTHPYEVFDNIIQDGGMAKSSGTFYSQERAHEIFRVLKWKGRLYFYLPKHGIKKGRDFGGEQLSRLKKAGFSLVKRYREKSFAILEK